MLDFIIRDEPARQPGSTRLLYRIMSELSERYFCAGWASGLEYSLWRAANGLGGRRRFICRCEAESLRNLAKRIGGWIVWDSGPRFVPMDKWLRTFAAHMANIQRT